MKLGVQLKRANQSAFTVCLLFAVSAFADTTVKCATPPGEEITCEDGQAAICDVKGGAVYGICASLGKMDEMDEDQIYGRLLSRVLNRDVDSEEAAQKKRLDKELQAQRWKYDDRIVTIVLPTGTGK